MAPLPRLVPWLLAGPACTPPPGSPFGHSRADEPADVLVYNNGAEPEFLDPGRASGHPDGRIISALFDGLTEYDPRDLSPRPSAAESWEEHPDGRGYTFHLRPEASWTDGHPLTAQDFVWSWERLLNPLNHSRYAQQLYAVRNARLYNRQRLYRLAASYEGLPEGTPLELLRSFAVRLLRDADALRAPEGGVVARLHRGALLPVTDTSEGWVEVRFGPACPDLGDLAALLDCSSPPVRAWVPLEATEEVVPPLDRRVVLRPVPLLGEGSEERASLYRGDEVVLLAPETGGFRVYAPGVGAFGWLPRGVLADPRGPLLGFEVRVHPEVDWYEEPRPEPPCPEPGGTGEPDEEEDAGGPASGEPFILTGDLLRPAPDLLGFRALDEHTLEVRLEGAAPYFLQQLAHFSLRAVPRWAVERWGSRWTRLEHIVTSGPFRLVEHRPRDRIVLERNEDWWGAERIRLSRIVAYSVDDVHASINLYRAGETDLVASNELPSELIPGLRGRPDFTSSPALAVFYLQVNTLHPPLDDPRVRRALSLAIDRRELVEVLQSDDRPADHFVPPGLEGYPEVHGPGTDPERARELLGAAGFPPRELPGGRRLAPGFPELHLLYNSQAANRLVAAVLQHQWKRELGIRVSLENREWKTYLKAVDAMDFDLARETWIGDYEDPATFLDLWRAGGGNNSTGWASLEYDALLEQAARAGETGTRMELLARAEAILNEEMPVIPLFWCSWVSLHQPDLRGWYPNLLDEHPLRDLWLDRPSR